jgi:hypothetical protein
MPAPSQPNGAASKRQLRAILVIAHPGHELRVHGWLETARPDVWVITDGSGRSNQSRIDSTTRVLEATGAVAGPVYGEFSDADLYNAVLGFDHCRFTKLVDQLAVALMRDRVDFITGDAEEGYNPAHDICRLIINAAVKLANSKSASQIANYDFTLVSSPGRCSDELRNHSLWLNLGDASFARKLSAARNYPELQAEVEAALHGSGDLRFGKHTDLAQRARSNFGVTEANNFRVECLRPVNHHSTSAMWGGDTPFYEIYGERQVKSGHYNHVLRYREHMLPLAAALDSHVERAIDAGA